MEILSTGEKIRRARIYKGYTLKCICEDKISVSKMSCIENSKVIPEDWILEFISKKLDLDIDYLKNDVKSQIRNNIEVLKKSNKRSSYEEDLEYNLSFAEEYLYYDEAFKIMHMIFKHNIEKGKFEKLQILIPKYYDICLKSKSSENQLTYYMDIGTYLYNSNEYSQAAGYYNTIRAESEKIGKNEVLAKATFNECACYIMMEDYAKAYEIAKYLIELVDCFKDDIKKADSYRMMAVLSLKMKKDYFKDFEEKSYSLYGKNKICKANAIYNYAEAMFNIGLKEQGVEYIKKALKCHPKEKEESLASFMITCIKELIKNNIVNEAEKISDEAINYSIDLDDIKYIEKAYHCKALILGKKNEFQSEEMYMNLSLDALIKFGSKKLIYERYLEMGNMYYKMNNTGESIKYFNLAINLAKRI